MQACVRLLNTWKPSRDSICLYGRHQVQRDVGGRVIDSGHTEYLQCRGQSRWSSDSQFVQVDLFHSSRFSSLFGCQGLAVLAKLHDSSLGPVGSDIAERRAAARASQAVFSASMKARHDQKASRLEYAVGSIVGVSLQPSERQRGSFVKAIPSVVLALGQDNLYTVRSVPRSCESVSRCIFPEQWPAFSRNATRFRDSFVSQLRIILTSSLWIYPV